MTVNLWYMKPGTVCVEFEGAVTVAETSTWLGSSGLAQLPYTVAFSVVEDPNCDARRAERGPDHSGGDPIWRRGQSQVADCAVKIGTDQQRE